MAHDSADDTMSSEELDKALEAEPADELIGDQLLGSAADVPLVEPRPEPELPRRDETRGLARALWFFGVVITALFVLQTIQIFLPRLPREVAATGGPSIRSSPVAPSPTPAEEIDRTLREMRVRLSRNLYEDVIHVLEPKAQDPGLDKDQRFEAYLLLAKAHRALGNQEKAQLWQLRATDQMVERREPAQVLEYASTLADQGQLAEARAELMKLLARRDGLSRKDDEWLSVAEARVADAWCAQAKRTKQIAPLPGADRDAATGTRGPAR